MKYPSTTLATISDAKIQEEVRKADLDLLAKINELELRIADLESRVTILETP